VELARAVLSNTLKLDKALEMVLAAKNDLQNVARGTFQTLPQSLPRSTKVANWRVSNIASK
jgi:hypothetical protein